MEDLEIRNPFACRQEGDRTAYDLFDRERGSAVGVAVDLGQDDAVELQSLVERLGGLNGVLTGHRVDDEERVMRAHSSGDPPHLVHELGVDRKAAGRVDVDHDVVAQPQRLTKAYGATLTGSVGLGEDPDTELSAPSTRSCSTAAGLLQVGTDRGPGGGLAGGTTVPTSWTRWFLPEPWRPASRTTVGGLEA